MGNELYAYSMVRTLYESGADYIDAFGPLVMAVLHEPGRSLSLGAVRDGVRKAYGLDIPQQSLETIVTRLTRRNLVVRSMQKVFLTESGRAQLVDLESERDVERRINELLEEGRHYFKSTQQVELSLDEMRRLLLSLVEEHPDLFEQFMAGTSSGPRPKLTAWSP